MRFRVSCSVLAKERFAIIRECLSSKPQDQQLEDGDHPMSSMSQLAKLTTALATVLCLTVPMGVTPASAQVNFGFSLGGPAPPPPPRVIVRPAAPHAGLIWREGHYGWRNGAYVWIDGDWLDPPYERAAWIPGHWIDRDGRHIWIEGHWEG